MALVDLWFEGGHHPFAEQAVWFRDLVEELGHTPRLKDRDTIFADSEDRPDLLVVGALYWSGLGETYRPLADAEMAYLKSHIAKGRPVLANHCVIGSFDERPELYDLWDGLWRWGESSHSPVEEFDVKVLAGSHAVVEGMSDFRIKDELYYNLKNPSRSRVVMEAEYDGGRWPLAWIRGGDVSADPARVVFSGLGHDMDSLASPSLRRFLENSVRWLLQD